MPKIILSKDDAVLREIVLSKERITIGRRPQNDIVIDSLAISGEHAVIVTRNKDSFLEDLNSTNGTQVNGQPVRLHFLQDQDEIELAQYRIRYIADATPEQGDTDGRLQATQPVASRLANVPRIKVLNGAKAGHETALLKTLTTVGKPGIQVAVIQQREDGYYLEHIEGDGYPLLNAQSIGANSCKLADGDLLELAGTQLQFCQGDNIK